MDFPLMRQHKTPYNKRKRDKPTFLVNRKVLCALSASVSEILTHTGAQF